jgi:Domain of unknown function (DUF6089)
LIRYIIISCFCFITLIIQAQSQKRNFRQRELCFLMGGSYYIGDLNPRGHFLFSKPAGGVFFRYSTNYRYAFRFGFNYGTLNANDANSKEADQKERNLNFTSKLYELNTIAEFNFVEYRIGHAKHKFTMFVFGGLAGFYFNPKSDVGNGLESLRAFKTEGQSSSYSKFKISIPFGVGFKYNLGPNAGLSVEWGPRRTRTDYLDDVSGSYPSASQASKFTNKSLDGSSTTGSMRGNPSTKDWYFYYGLTLNFKLKEFNKPCYKGG